MTKGRAGISRAAESLSEGQRVCLRMVQLQMTSKEISRHLGISSHTVDQRIRFAMRTLGASSRAEAALILTSQECPETPGIKAVNLDAQSRWPHLCDVDTRLEPQLMHQTEALVEVSDTAAQGFGGPPVGPSVDYRTVGNKYLQEEFLRSIPSEFDNRDNGSRLSGSRQADEGAIRVVNEYANGIDWKWKTFFVFVVAIMCLLSVSALINAMIVLSAFLN